MSVRRKNMKKTLNYTAPTVEIIYLLAEDILTVSGGFFGDEHTLFDNDQRGKSGFWGE